MNEAVLDWHTPLDQGRYTQALYREALGHFLQEERDSSAEIVGWITQGKTDQALEAVRRVKERATDLGAKALSHAAFSLEIAIKGGADTASSLPHFESVFVDTMLAIAVYVGG
ncbi:MAG: Hpt domain-containing protein [Desulfovibrio sp.]|nr:Hpt domain-containing protein [Desulfovibrio sp.]